MNDLISKTAALDAIDGIKPIRGNLGQLLVKSLCYAVVKIMQPVDAMPVVHGRWLTHDWVHGVAYCSNCAYELKSNNTNFCHECGTKMDKMD